MSRHGIQGRGQGVCTWAGCTAAVDARQVAALVLARRFDLGVVATAVAVLLGLAPACLGRRAFRADRAEAGPADLARVAADLAFAVMKQWADEAAARRADDPLPLPVAWQAARPPHRTLDAGRPRPCLAGRATG